MLNLISSITPNVPCLYKNNQLTKKSFFLGAVIFTSASLVISYKLKGRVTFLAAGLAIVSTIISFSIYRLFQNSNPLNSLKNQHNEPHFSIQQNQEIKNENSDNNKHNQNHNLAENANSATKSLDHESNFNHPNDTILNDHEDIKINENQNFLTELKHKYEPITSITQFLSQFEDKNTFLKEVNNVRSVHFQILTLKYPENNCYNTKFFEPIIENVRIKYFKNSKLSFSYWKTLNDSCNLNENDFSDYKSKIINLIEENQRLLDPNYEYTDLYYLIVILPAVEKHLEQKEHPDGGPEYTYKIDIKSINNINKCLIKSSFNRQEQQLLKEIFQLNDDLFIFYGKIQKYELKCRKNEYKLSKNVNNDKELKVPSRNLGFNKSDFLNNYAGKIFNIVKYIDNCIDKENNKSK
ncbi:MAG: hypothetical protein Q8K60_01790 [Parachlamydiaceae bacterium]|nr:hypothetical protein [Parachlamydiaceae bacterium]